MTIKLETCALKMSVKQVQFEHCLILLGIKLGMFAIAQCSTKYVNDHVQWFWEQYNRK